MALTCAVMGCHHEGAIRVDLSTGTPRFIIEHQGWPRPFWTPRVTEFAIASEEDGPIWQLESIDSRGLAAKQLVIEYGRVPAGFAQVYPEGGLRPRSLQTRRNYFVAAGGQRAVYRIVFAMPITGWTPILPNATPKLREPDRMDITTTQPAG